MKYLKKSLSLLLALAFIVSSIVAISPTNAAIVDAAGAKYEYISFLNEKTKKCDNVVKNGKYYLRVRGNKVQIKEGKVGKYKKTKINAYDESGFVGNGNSLLFIEKNGNSSTIRSYNYSTGKIKKLAKLPGSETQVNGKKYEISHIVGLRGDYVFFCSYNADIAHEGSVMYSFNVKNNKIKKTELTGFSNEVSYGKYLLAADGWRTDVRTMVYSIYMFTKDGNVKKIKKISDNTYDVKVYNKSLYWVDASMMWVSRKDPTAEVGVLYTMKLDGTGKKKLFTETEGYPIFTVEKVNSKGVYIRDYEFTYVFKYDFKTGKMKKFIRSDN